MLDNTRVIPRRHLNTLVMMLGVSNICSIVALVFSLAVFSSRTASITKAVQESAYRSCVLIDGILHSFSTPTGKASARLIILSNPALGNCHKYSLQLP